MTTHRNNKERSKEEGCGSVLQYEERHEIGKAEHENDPEQDQRRWSLTQSYSHQDRTHV